MYNNTVDENFISEVMSEWAEFTKPEDPDAKVIKLDSWDFTFSRYNEKIQKLSGVYNIPGELTVIYLKNLFRWYLEKASISLLDMYTNAIDLTHTTRLFELFNDSRIEEFEESFYKMINYISSKLVGNNKLGQIDCSKAVENSLDIIFDELDKCQLEIYQKGGKIDRIRSVSTNIHVFNTLVECQTFLSSQPDGLYTCYISNHNTSDGYFGFFVNNNGNMFSINERVPEAFMGQHQNGRNHRFTDRKPDGIFPYELFSFSNYDYKGYAKTYKLKKADGKEVSLTDLSQSSYLTLLVVILMIFLRFENKELEGEIVYSNFSLKNNRMSLNDASTTDLMVINNSPVVAYAENKLQNIISELTTDGVLKGLLNEEFSRTCHPELSYSECGEFRNNIFVAMYGDGFEFDPNKVLVDTSIKLLRDSNAVINAEFVGTEKELRLQVYHEARKQLATYIEDKMAEELKRFKDTYKDAQTWYNSRIAANYDRVKEFVVRQYVNAKANDSITHEGWRRANNKFTVHYDYDENAYRYQTDAYVEKPCTCKIILDVSDWTDIELILGEEVPKIIKGFEYSSRRYNSNPLLNVVDKVAMLQTPFESTGSFSYDPDRCDFSIRMYFSKLGLNKYIKEKGIVAEANDNTSSESIITYVE